MRKNYCYLLILFVAIFPFLLGCNDEKESESEPEPDIVSEIVSELNFTTGANNQIITFTTNKEWVVTVSSPQGEGDVSWCSISPLGGSAGTANITISTTENTDYDDRSAVITIKTGNTVKTLAVTQEQKDAIILSKKNYELSDEGGTFEIEANINVEIDVLIPSEITWLRMKASEIRSLSTKNIEFIVDKNMTSNIRGTIITIKDKNSSLYSEITVTQQAKKIVAQTIHVDIPGTLESLLGNNFLQIDELTIIGEINGTDINIIREMAGNNRIGKPTDGFLSKLDLSNASIIEGGNPYYYPDNYEPPCQTSNNIIGNYMFYSCNSLKELILPKTIEEIQIGSISYCENLINVRLFDGIKKIGVRAFEMNKNLKKINLPESIIFLDKSVFSNCRSLSSVVLPSKILSIEQGSFFYCIELSEIKIPNSVSVVKQSAFEGCESLTKVVIPDAVEVIEPYAFRNCIRINKITFGNNIKHIGHDALKESYNLAEIFCKASVPPAISNWIMSLTFNENIYDKCKVYIPKGSYESYYTDSGWRKFENLIETSF
jgi:hypothetical protein